MAEAGLVSRHGQPPESAGLTVRSPANAWCPKSSRSWPQPTGCGQTAASFAAEADGVVRVGTSQGLGDCLDHVFGFVLSGQQWAKRHLGDLHNEKFKVLDPHVRIYRDSADTAVGEAVQQQTTTTVGRDTSGSFRLGLVAVRTGQAWRIAHIQLSGPLIKPGEMPPFGR